MEENPPGLGAQALVELDIIRMQPALERLRAALRTAVDDFAKQGHPPGLGWVGLLHALGSEVGLVLDAARAMPEAEDVLDEAIAGAITQCERQRPLPGAAPLDNVAATLLSDELLGIVGRHMRQATAREEHVLEALGALAATTAVVLRAAGCDPAARRYFNGTLAAEMAPAKVGATPQSG